MNEQQQNKQDEIDALWEKETKTLFATLEIIGDQYREMAKSFKIEHGVDMDWRADADNALGM